MFRKKTLLVVGAGASAEYGLPVGEELRHWIAESLELQLSSGLRPIIIGSGQGPIDAAVRSLVTQGSENGTPDDYKAAAASIRDNMYAEDSIDQFLHLKRDSVSITRLGKILIALNICRAERQSKMFSQGIPIFRPYEGTWLNLFAKILFENASVDQIGSAFAKVDIICFNYDRCIETHIFRVLCIRFGLTPSEASERMRSFSIIHPYGQVGALPWQSVEAPKVDFGDTEEMEKQLVLMPNQLRTFTESDHNDILMNEAMRVMMESAERTLFLGFSYNTLNMDLMKRQGRLGTGDLSGTTMGMPHLSVRKAGDMAKGLVVEEAMAGGRRIIPNPYFDSLPVTCHDFIRDRRAVLADD